jgi:hypothetical protein
VSTDSRLSSASSPPDSRPKNSVGNYIEFGVDVHRALSRCEPRRERVGHGQQAISTGRHGRFRADRRQLVLESRRNRLRHRRTQLPGELSGKRMSFLILDVQAHWNILPYIRLNYTTVSRIAVGHLRACRTNGSQRLGRRHGAQPGARAAAEIERGPLGTRQGRAPHLMPVVPSATCMR